MTSIFSDLQLIFWNDVDFSNIPNGTQLTTEHRPTWMLGSRRWINPSQLDREVRPAMMPLAEAVFLRNDSSWIHCPTRLFRIQKSSKDQTRKWAFQLQCLKRFNVVLLGVSITSTAFISLTTSMGWISCNGLADRGQKLCFNTASHNIAACNSVDFYYGKMLLLKWS